MKEVGEIRSSLARIFQKFGIKYTDANVLATLFIENDSLSVNDLKERLNYSVSGITLSLHRLMKSDLVARYKRGKKYLYKAESGILSVLHHLIEEIRRHDIPRLKRRLREKIRIDKYKYKLESLKEKIEAVEEHLNTLLNHLKICEEAI